MKYEVEISDDMADTIVVKEMERIILASSEKAIKDAAQIILDYFKI